MPADLEKLRSIGYLSRGRTQARSMSGREHPESGLPYKATTDELGHTVTVHGEPGTAVDSRQDVNIAAPHVTGFGSDE